MAMTNRMTDGATSEAATLARVRPELSDRLWRVLVRQTDEVAALMGQGDEPWRDGLSILSDAAERTRAPKLRTVARHARRMDDPAAGRDRQHARAAFRRAARMDAGLSA